MQNRNTYVSPSFSYQVGQIGRLNACKRFYVNAGDSMDIDYQCLIRLSPLRRNLVLDAHVDLFAFFVPHRHVYGQAWIDFMFAGVDGTTPLATETITAGWDCLAAKNYGGTVPKHVPQGYANIWNRYFRQPTDNNFLADDLTGPLIHGLIGAQNNWGRVCCNMKNIWSTGHIANQLDADDSTVVGQDVLGVPQFDILDLIETKKRYESETDRDWFGIRYSDLMKDIYGHGVNTDADQRPTLLARNSSWLSGFDVDGTAASNLGQYAGKSASQANLRVPRRVFPEHGMIWIMQLVRFPTIHKSEQQYLDSVPSPSYKQLCGDPAILSAEPPIDMINDNFFTGSANGAISLGTQPYGQWHRTEQNNVHIQYDAVQGFPFLDSSYPTIAAAQYVDPDDYDSVFQSDSLKHWQSYGRVNLTKNSLVPTARQSIFAGAN